MLVRSISHLFVRRVLSLLALTALLAGLLSVVGTAPASAADDNLTQLNLRRLSVFTNWLKTYNVPGEISEVGWPGDRSPGEEAEWNTLATKWYAQAAAANIPVAYWATGETSVLDPFANGANQLPIIQAQGAQQKGLDIGGAEYAGDPYPTAAVMQQAVAAGVTWVRIPFRWESLQPTSGGALDPVQVSRLQSTVNAALQAGLTVEIENHNYARYNNVWTNSTQLSDFWSKLAPEFPDHRVSFGIMEEPHDQPSNTQSWETISQATLTAIRNAGSTNLISVSGDHFSNAHYWSCDQPTPWISDPANNYRYEADQYFDATTVGVYSTSNTHDNYSPQSYDTTYAAAVADSGVAEANACPLGNTTVTVAQAPDPGAGVVTGSTAVPAVGPPLVTDPNTADTGYHVVTAGGKVYPFGQTDDFGSLPSPDSAGIAAIASTPTKRGYWLVGASGNVYSYGDAQYFGGMGGQHLNQPIVGMAATADGGGYWLLGRDGGIFSFGDAPFYGSTGSIKLNAPVVAMQASPAGGGYWFVASDGGVFSYGPGAHFYGSTGSIKLNKPVVSMAAAPDDAGYWLVASDGGVFAYGAGAQFYGSTGSIKLNKPVIGIVPTSGGAGYRMVASDGGVFAFGDAPFSGSLGSSNAGVIVGMSN